MDENIQKLQQMVDESHRIVFFGGAGVSTESGIPDSLLSMAFTIKNLITHRKPSSATAFLSATRRSFTISTGRR